MISDTDYLLWLERDAERRVVLVEADAYAGGVVTTHTFASSPFVSRPGDAPANTPYDDLLQEIPAITRRMSEALGGQTTVTWGDLLIDNSDGERDHWLDAAWDGRPCRLLLGSPEWPKSDYRVILSGTLADIGARDARQLTLKLRDKQALLNAPIQTDVLAGNRLTPLCYGQCFNVEPVLVDSATLVYQVHDGQIHAIAAVRDNGVALTPGSGYSTDLSAGTFTLLNAPVGRITADVHGAKPGGVYLTRIADLVAHIVTTRAGLSSSDLDSASLAAFGTLCPQPVGLYLRERINLLEVLDQLLTSVGGWYGFNRAGLLQLGRLDLPSGAPRARFSADDMVRDSFKILSRRLPQASVRVSYATNWTPQSDGIAGGVSAANRELFAAEHRIAKTEDASIAAAHPLASNPDVVVTRLVESSDAAAEAARRLTLWGAVRTTYEAEFFTAPLHLELGDVIELDHHRFGFAGGQLARIVGIKESPANGRVVLEFWR